MNKRNIVKASLLSTVTSLILLTLASATSPATTTTTVTVQNLAGVQIVITNAFSILPGGSNWALALMVLNSTGPSTLGCIWTQYATCQAFTVVGDWGVIVALQLNKVPSTTTSYKITSISPYLQSYETFSVPSTATVGSFMSFILNLGSPTLPSATGFIIDVE